MDFWEEKNVLITGATGMVGSNIVEKLINKKANVVALVRSIDRRSYFYLNELNKKCIAVFGDLKNYEKICDIIGRYEIDIILHLGAQPIVVASLLNPLETFKVNIMGTVNILEAARKFDVKCVVVASSDKAYGESKKLPYTEDMPLQGLSPYDISKSCADMISLSYYKNFSLPVTVSRFGNIYGPGDLNFNRIIPGAIRAALKNEVLKIRSDGKMIREYTFVKDVVEGYMLLAEKINLSKGEAFNFGSGEILNVLEVVNKVEKVTGKNIKKEILNIAKNEIKAQYLSSEKAQKILGWKAKYKIEEGLKETLPYYEKILSDMQ